MKNPDNSSSSTWLPSKPSLRPKLSDQSVPNLTLPASATQVSHSAWSLALHGAKAAPLVSACTNDTETVSAWVDLSGSVEARRKLLDGSMSLRQVMRACSKRCTLAHEFGASAA
mmetsp:Transcript_75089/g.125171  ORF Transcript_75089/g.125171 Transcript_75089/m.125171 type:complete len:114 (-) Transcript_75089:100-441(-)